VLDIAMTGSRGMIGRALTAFLRSGGHRVHPIVRTPPKETEIGWQPEEGHIDQPRLEGLDAVIHLAGENIADRRWTSAQMNRIRASRVVGTDLLARTLARLDRPPRMLLSASAVGYYGDAGAAPAAEAGIRVTLMRTGVVLDPTGGALAKMLPIFRAGLGGRLGSGRQWMSWISLEDAVGAIYHLLTSDVSGPVNLVAPAPVTNTEFTQTLAGLLKRPALFPVPAPALRIVVGRMADEALLASARVHPGRLLELGYAFNHSTLPQALEQVLRRQAH
jgi:NAD dependent epimerase/dehydratase family enzyme